MGNKGSSAASSPVPDRPPSLPPLFWKAGLVSLATNLSAEELLRLRLTCRAAKEAVDRLPELIWKEAFMRELWFGHWLAATPYFWMGPDFVFDSWKTYMLEMGPTDHLRLQVPKNARDVSWDALSWRDRCRLYFREPILPRVTSKNPVRLVVGMQTCDGGGERVISLSRDKKGQLLVDKVVWTEAEEHVLEKAMYRLSFEAQVAWGSTSQIGYRLCDKNDVNLLPDVAYPHESCILDFSMGPRCDARRLLDDWPIWEQISLDEVRPWLEQQGRWYV